MLSLLMPSIGRRLKSTCPSMYSIVCPSPLWFWLLYGRHASLLRLSRSCAVPVAGGGLTPLRASVVVLVAALVAPAVKYGPLSAVTTIRGSIFKLGFPRRPYGTW